VQGERSGAEITVTRAKGLLRINNKIVKATVDDFKVGDWLMAATLQPDVPEIDSELIDRISPRKALFMSEARLSTSQHATSVRTLP
jgi:hypothetical protein